MLAYRRTEIAVQVIYGENREKNHAKQITSRQQY